MKLNPGMTCNTFHTELTSTTNKRNNLSIHPLVCCRLAVAPLRIREELTLSSEVAGTGTYRLETRSGGRVLQKRENLLYVGIDLHKESHTAVMVNCWNEKLEVVVIENKPSEFKKLAEKVAEMILDCVQNDGNTFREYQESRDFITTSLVRDLEHQKEELAGLDQEIEKILLSFDYKLTSMPGIGTSIASKLIAEIGDIRRFPSADKLARFAGVAPVKFSSAGKGKEQSSRQGNRQLHGLFYFLAVTMVSKPKNGILNHPVFYDYYMRKIGEGKTKSQALVCIMRRLVNIVYGMMKNKTEYREPIREEEQ